MRFIGCKANMLEILGDVIRKNVRGQADVFMDLFSGTGAVGAYFKKDFRILSNDHLYFSYILQRATLENNTPPDFRSLQKAGVEDPFTYLENEPYQITDDFFITKYYSPWGGCERMYFTVENAGRIDFIRLKLREWKDQKLISDREFTYFLAVLIEAVPFVSNISGTYGAYLKHWDKRALGRLKLKRLEITDNGRKNKCWNEDANQLIRRVKGDILYLDPPYNSRQFITNYHLLETIARYDSPEIYGVTGLRPYEKEKSVYCLKDEVAGAFRDIIQNAGFRHILVSYSSDGLLTEREIRDILLQYGVKSSYRLYKIPYRRYRSKHQKGSDELIEYIFYIRKPAKTQKHTGKYAGKHDGKYAGKHDGKLNADRTKKVHGMNYIKSPLNYIGGKFDLLGQILPLFPKKIHRFVDLFAGGFNVGVNVGADEIFANDINFYVLEILETLKNEPVEDVIGHIEGRIREFGLSRDNEEGFLKFRDCYNRHKTPLDLYTLLCHSFNYQIRFNNNLEYNNPFGRNRSRFSGELKKKLIRFSRELKKKNIIFSSLDFQKFDFSQLECRDFVYCDPPYLITTGSYNDGNRGFKDWNIDQEITLLNLLDSLNNRGIRFALSNVLSHKGGINPLLIEWSSIYHIHHLKHSFSNSSHNTCRGESEEVLITNY